jgi:hypothetical protein
MFLSGVSNLFLIGLIMSSPDGDGNASHLSRKRDRPPNRHTLRRGGHIVAERGTVHRKRSALRFHNCENLSFGNHVVDADKNGFEPARCRRRDRYLHFHRFDEHDVLAVPNAAADRDGQGADASGHLGYDLDFWHGVLRDSRRAHWRRIVRIAKGDALGFLLWRQIA